MMKKDFFTLLMLVQDLRETQKQYFATRSKTILAESIAKEETLDQFLDQLTSDYAEELEAHRIVR